MTVTLIGAGQEENLALGYLASSLQRAGHQAEVLAFDGPGDARLVVESVSRARPGLVGMSVAFQHRIADFRDLSEALREAGVFAPIVWGGHVPTARPGQILQRYPDVDVVVRHDAEDTIVELAAAFEDAPLPPPVHPHEARRIETPLLGTLAALPGLAFRLPEGRTAATGTRAVTADLDSLAPPWRPPASTRVAGLGFAPVLGSRGCWQRCTYCSIQTYHRGRGGPRVRFRSMNAVAAEMADLYHGRQDRIFCFHDENFLLPRPSRTLARLDELEAALRREGVGRIGIVAKCRPDELAPEVLDAAKRMGFLRVYVGIENGSQHGLDHLGRDTTVAECETALDQLRAADLYACFNILLFEPDTILDDVADNLRFLKRYVDFPFNFCRAEVYPGSFLERDLKARGRLRGGLEGMTYTIADPAAELLFRITAVAFGGRNFGARSTANSASGVGYLSAVLDRFYPGREVRDFRRRTEAVVRNLGEDTLTHLGSALAFVSGNLPSATETRAFTADLALKVAVADARFWPALEALRTEMDRYGAARAGAIQALASRRPGFASAAVLVAAAGLAMNACEKSTSSDVPDTKDVFHVHDDPAVSDLGGDPIPKDVQEIKDTLIICEDGPPWDMVVDPLPPDVPDVTVVDPPPPDITEPDITVVDPPPPDITEPDIMVVDPPPPDITEPDLTVVDPPPPDVIVVDPLPPDVSSDEGSDTQDALPDLLPMDPAPPPQDAGASRPHASALPLDRAFRVTLESRAEGDFMVFEARTPGYAAPRLRWHAMGGDLSASGREARFRPDGSAEPLVLVTAEAADSLLDAARWVPGRGKT
jgi:radical SAM superfamily enzyme YgiQ (UPF0313 family)